MSGAANIEKLRERQQQSKLEKSDRPMLGLIARARLNLDEMLNPHRTQDLVNSLQGASNHLSKQILKYWSQNKHIRLQFDVRQARPGDPEGMTAGTNLWGMVYDDVHQVSTRLGKRSKGFIWFFSFLAWYSQQPQDQPLILLLDEPGLFLHGSAQGDFLRYMEAELKDRHQVIYTTHSPFMVDAKHFDRVRIVEDKSMTSDDELPLDKRGTKVTEDVLDVDEGTLFPLQGALGYEIAQTLFVGPNSLIVEGVSDLMYLQTISSLLTEKGHTGLRDEWIITPVGGSEKVPTFAALIGIQPGMNVATLIDLQKKDQQSVENIYKRKLLKKSHVLTFAEFAGKSEADIEDMFEPDFYLKLVNSEYGTAIAKPLKLAGLPAGGVRILPRIEAALSAGSGNSQFNHYRPARYFAENISKLTGDLSDATLDRFEKAFIALNKLI
jgi:predicted ATP-dependent endonuclease of OLD family